MIEVSNLSKRYGELAAIQDVTFRVEKGEILGFLGRNGAGKTTTMRILAGSLAATEGKASIAGFDIEAAPFEAKRRLGYLPEQPPLYLEMTVTSFLEFAARIKGVPSSGVPSAVGSAIERAGLAQVRRRLVGNLSKGYRQRVGIAQALVHDPEVLVLDEPTEGLDPQQIIEIRELIRGLKDAHTVILSTHILPEVEQVCDRVLIIEKGRILVQDSLAGLQAQSTSAWTVSVRVLRETPDLHGVFLSVPGVVAAERHPIEGAAAAHWTVTTQPDEAIRAALAEAVVRSGAGLIDLHREAAKLEDAFLRIIRGQGAEG